MKRTHSYTTGAHSKHPGLRALPASDLGPPSPLGLTLPLDAVRKEDKALSTVITSGGKVCKCVCVRTCVCVCVCVCVCECAC
jgi:hypothetical protein